MTTDTKPSQQTHTPSNKRPNRHGYSGGGRILPAISPTQKHQGKHLDADKSRLREASAKSEDKVNIRHQPPAIFLYNHQTSQQTKWSGDKPQVNKHDTNGTFNSQQHVQLREANVSPTRCSPQETTPHSRRWVYRQPMSHDISPHHDSSHSPLVGSTQKLSLDTTPVLTTDQTCPRRYVDRKAMARRHLVGGLIGGNYVPETNWSGGIHSGGVSIRDDARRTQSFHHHHNNHGGSVGIHDSSRRVASGNDGLLRSRNKLRRTNSLQYTTGSQDKAKQAIDEWNRLVHELHWQQASLNVESAHLAVMSDSNSSTDTDNDSGVGKNETKFVKLGKPLMKKPSNMTVTSMPFKNMKFPLGIGMYRYRPLTPNLIAKLDKQKLPTKRRTQLWINSIQDPKRTILIPMQNCSVGDDDIDNNTIGLSPESQLKHEGSNPVGHNIDKHQNANGESPTLSHEFL